MIGKALTPVGPVMKIKSATNAQMKLLQRLFCLKSYYGLYLY